MRCGSPVWQEEQDRRSFVPILHAMILTHPLMGAHHQKQGADTHDRAGISTHHVLQTRLGELSASPRRNHRTAFIRTTCPPCCTTLLVNRRASRPYDRCTRLLVLWVD